MKTNVLKSGPPMKNYFLECGNLQFVKLGVVITGASQYYNLWAKLN